MHTPTVDHRSPNLQNFLKAQGLFGDRRVQLGLVVLAVMGGLGWVGAKGWYRARYFQQEAVPRIQAAVANDFRERAGRCVGQNCRTQFPIVTPDQVQIDVLSKPSMLKMGISWFSVDVPFEYTVVDQYGSGTAVMLPPDKESVRRGRNRHHRTKRWKWRVIDLELEGLPPLE